MRDEEKLAIETSLAALGRGYFGVCVLGGLIWIVLAFSESAAPAVMLSIGVGLIITGAIVFNTLRILVSISDSLRLLVSQTAPK